MKVVELMSFSKAAEALYVSQQAVSLHIKHLETTYDTQLFERHPSLRLTSGGQQLLEAAKDIIEREERLLHQLTASQENYEGEISIGLPPNRSTAFVNEFIPEFCSIYPKMSLRLDEKTSSNLSSAVKANEIDLALPLLSEESSTLDSSVFISLPLETESLYLIISDDLLQQQFPHDYPFCKRSFLSGISLHDFSNLPMFLHPSNSHLHEAIVDRLIANGTVPFIRIRTTLTSSLVQLCARGYGIFFSSPMLLKHLYTSNKECFEALNIFPVKEFQNNRQTTLVYHRKKFLSKPITDSIRIIQSIYASHKNFINEYNEAKSQ